MKERRKKMNRKYKLNNNTAKRKNLTTIRKQKKIEYMSNLFCVYFAYK